MRPARSRLALLTVVVLVALPMLAACGEGADTGGSGDVNAPAKPKGEARDVPVLEDLDVAVAPVEQRIVKEATVGLEVADEGFDDALQRASLVGRRHGGYLSGSERTDDAPRTARVILRVPSDRFDEALAEVRGLGRVTDETSSSEDVTSRYVDLQSRLRNWLAQETVLLGLMERASSIDESITVQRRLQEVQLTIERLRGQLRVLGDRTDLSTITVELREPGAAPSENGTVIGDAWRAAAGGFVGVVAAGIVGLGYTVPIALAGLAVWFVVRRVRSSAEAELRADV